MAEDDDDKSEQPSQRKLDQAFEDGNVPLSREAVGAAVIVAGGGALVALAGPLREACVALVSDLPRAMQAPGLQALPPGAWRLIGLAALVPVSAALAAAVATLVQTRTGLWPDKVAPDVAKLFSPERFTRLVSKELLVDVGLALLRTAAIGLVVWSAARDKVPGLLTLLAHPPELLLSEVFDTVVPIARAVVLAVAGLAVVDVLVVRRRFFQRLRMTKDEIRRENKEEEGDPLIRSRRRRKHRELAKGRADVEVPRADALLVNPTHVAIALRYRKDEGKAPRVVAKGKGQLAEIMRDLARSHGVPIVQDIPLARLLYRRVKVGREVPADTYKAVAAVLAFVYRLTRPPRRPSSP